MNWDALGAIAELLGAIAVFLTLVYLAHQIRQNTKAVRSTAVDASINTVMGVRSLIAQDAELADILLRGNADPDSLNPTEQVRHMVLLSNIVWGAWNVYSQAKYADTGVWESQLAVMRRVLNTPGGKRFLEERGNEISLEFKLELEKALTEGSDTQ